MRKALGLTNEVLWKLYREDLLTMQEIADRFGVTKQLVWHRLGKLGVDYHVSKLIRKCERCGNEFEICRGRVKRSGGKYCSMICYHSSVSIYGTYSRRGQRQARKVSGAVDGQVVHHINGDTLDNRPENLIVFESNGAHMSFHKSGAAKILKEKVESGDISISYKSRGGD